MEFYSKSKPNLIVPEVKETVHKIIKHSPNNLTVSEKVSKMMYDFYKTFIEANKFIFLFFIIVTVFLLYRYYNKKSNNTSKEKKEGFKDITEYKNIDIDTLNKSLESLDQERTIEEQQTYPSFNPTQKTECQVAQVLPDPMPMPNINGQPWNGIRQDQGNYQTIQTPFYDPNAVHGPTRSYYTGLTNTYKYAQDPNIPNPLYNNNLNSQQGNFISGMVNQNRNNIVNYEQMIKNMNNSLENSLNYGPEYLNEEYPEYTMEPPYST